LKSLAKISFCSCQIGDTGAQVLFEGLKASPSIREIDLAKNNLSYIAAIYISDTLKTNYIIQKINLYWNKIGPEGAKYLSQAKGNLSELNLSENEIKAEGIKALADYLAFSQTLISLNLNRNNSYESSFSLHVAEFLAISVSLEKIDLGNNFIGYDGIKSIFLALRTNTLSKLSEISLESNEIDNRATVLISDFLQIDSNLTSLNLTNNYLGPEGAQALTLALKVNKSLKLLFLANNRLGNDGCCCIAQGLRFNKSLVTIDLGKNEIEKKGINEMESAISKNDNLSLQNIIFNEKNIETKSLLNIITLLKKKRKMNNI
jgi:Ran GTPase-activating protein (RanGAP) involved in mRNA processing and transport